MPDVLLLGGLKTIIDLPIDSAKPVSNNHMLHGRSPSSWYNVTSTHSHCVQHEGSAMHHQHLTPFVGQRYLNLESYKRDGTPVQTPVWFAEEQGVLYVYTLANAGKVKRIRR